MIRAVRVRGGRTATGTVIGRRRSIPRTIDNAVVTVRTCALGNLHPTNSPVVRRPRLHRVITATRDAISKRVAQCTTGTSMHWLFLRNDIIMIYDIMLCVELHIALKSLFAHLFFYYGIRECACSVLASTRNKSAATARCCYYNLY